MNPRHRSALNSEIAAARSMLRAQRYAAAMTHLERAHVLGQMHFRAHMLVHYLMLVVAARRLEIAAALGQIARIVLGTLGHALGRLPAGNTGGSDVSMFAAMPIDPELAAIMREDDARLLR